MSVIVKKRCCCKAEGGPCSGCIPLNDEDQVVTVSIDCDAPGNANCETCAGDYEFVSSSSGAGWCCWNFVKTGASSCRLYITYDETNDLWYASFVYASLAAIYYNAPLVAQQGCYYVGFPYMGPIDALECSEESTLAGTFTMDGCYAINPDMGIDKICQCTMTVVMS